jgi:hypothetical protein
MGAGEGIKEIVAEALTIVVPKALVIIGVVVASASALPERIEDGKDPMIYDSIKNYRIQLDPVGTMPNVDVGVRVDGRDIPNSPWCNGPDFGMAVFVA